MFLFQVAFTFQKYFNIHTSEFLICYIALSTDFVQDAGACLNKYVTDSERKLVCNRYISFKNVMPRTTTITQGRPESYLSRTALP